MIMSGIFIFLNIRDNLWADFSPLSLLGAMMSDEQHKQEPIVPLPPIERPMPYTLRTADDSNGGEHHDVGALKALTVDYQLGLEMSDGAHRLDSAVLERFPRFEQNAKLGNFSWWIGKIVISGTYRHVDVMLAVGADNTRCALISPIIGRITLKFHPFMTWRELAWRLWSHDDLRFADPERILEAAANMGAPFPDIEADDLFRLHRAHFGHLIED